ncbi:MAG: condensation domain-containing protein, partial [Pseudomonadales bacterium]|nr:condensation domain-containing protein [Pseudomonadales bacterium]
MTTPVDIVARLTPYIENGLHLWVENDGLRFKAPKSVIDEELVGLLRQEKPALISWLTRQEQQNGASNSSKAGSALNDEEVVKAELSSTQSAIWMLYKFSPNNAAYNTAFICELDPGVDVAALERAVQALFVLHPMLRTTFDQNEIDGQQGTPKQTIWKTRPFKLQVQDISDQSEEAIDAAVALEADKPFDLRNDSILRVKLLQCSGGRLVLVATIHHIGADLWSLVLIAEQLKSFYELASQNKPILVKPLAKTYIDHVTWQNDYLKSDQGRKAKAFWSSYLSSAPINITLPEDHPRPALLSMESKLLSIDLDCETTGRIRDYSRKAGITPFVLMQAAFQILTAKETGLRDFLIGTPSLGRTIPGMDKVVGDFANPITMRSSLKNANTISEFLHKTQASLHAGLEFQEYPFPNLVQDCNPARDASRTPLFQLMFIWHQANTDHLSQNPLIKKLWRESGPRGTPYDVMLSVSDLGTTLELNWTYQTALYEERTIKRFCENYLSILSLLMDIDANNYLAAFLSSVPQVAIGNSTISHTSKISLDDLNEDLPKRNAYYRYRHADSIDNIFKQIFVEGDPFESVMLSQAFHEVIFVERLPYGEDGDVDNTILDELLSVNHSRLQNTLTSNETISERPYVNYRYELYPTIAEEIKPTSIALASSDHAKCDSLGLDNRGLAYALGPSLASDSGHTQSLIEALKLTAIRKPLGGFTFIQMGGADERYCYRDLFRDALSVSEKLLSQGFIDQIGPKANIVILQMDVCKAFFAVWWGLVIAGYKPLVIAKPNKLERDNALAAKLYNVATSMDDIAVIADSAVVKETKAFLNHKIAVVS